MLPVLQMAEDRWTASRMSDQVMQEEQRVLAVVRIVLYILR